MVNVTKLGLKKDGKEVRIRQVKSNEVICYRCQKKGHISKKCKLDKEKLKCTHCNSVGKHITNDWCKNQLKRKEEENAGVPAKANSLWQRRGGISSWRQ